MGDSALALAVAQSEGISVMHVDDAIRCLHRDVITVKTEDDVIISRLPARLQRHVLGQIVVARRSNLRQIVNACPCTTTTCRQLVGLITMLTVRATDEMIRMLACLLRHKRRRVHRIANILPTRHIQPGSLLVGQLCHSLVNGSQQRLDLVHVLRRHLVRQGINKCLRILYIGVCIARVAAADIVTADGIAGGGELLLFCHCSRVLCKGRRGLHGKAESKCHEQT